MPGAEALRLEQDTHRERNWKRWGPYLAERQWGTVREDYSADGNVWDYFSHDQSRSRAYRWGEDGLLGITDRQGRLCFGLALWNERDPILKERLFGLTGPEGNHGEDVKELYYYLDSTPTHSYLKGLYKYPQGAFPYEALVRVKDPAQQVTLRNLIALAMDEATASWWLDADGLWTRHHLSSSGLPLRDLQQYLLASTRGRALDG